MIYPDLVVELNAWELRLAGLLGVEHWQRRAIHGSGQGGDRGNVAVELEKYLAGRLAELAVAKWTGRYWTGPDGRGASDVSGLEVRGRRGDPGDESLPLLLQPYDERNHPHTPFMLAVGSGARWRIAGFTTPTRARSLVALGQVTVGDPGNRGAPVLIVPQWALEPPDPFKADPIRRASIENAA